MTPTTPQQLRRALLVEDDPVFQEALSRVFPLLVERWSLTRVDRAAAALQWIESSKLAPDLLLVDIGLPDASGIEVIRAARQRFPEVPVMVVSVITAKSTLMAAIRAGASGYLLKGETTATLQRSIEDVLFGNYPVSPSLARHLFQIAGAPQHHQGVPEIHLTSREMDLLKLLSQGMSYMECAESMSVAISTVQSHVRTLYRKLQVNTQMQAVSKARKFGVLE